MNQKAAAERVRALAGEIRAASGSHAPLEGDGRGIVVVAGGARIFTNVYVLLHVLRHTLNSTLPVELWYFGQGEISPAMAALVEPLNVRLVDANPLIAAAGARVRDGWQLKSFALLHSRFAEVLLLDADQVPVSDPAACFEWPEYREAGAVFWPDIVDLRRDNAIWPALGLAARRATSIESGQLLVDRRRHGEPLRAALRLNEAADDVYELIYGDKDTYLLAWEMLGAPYAVVPHRPYGDEFVLVQRDFAGNALFQHRTNAKWQYGGEQRAIFGFQHADACLAALRQLERNWSGEVFTPPDRSSAAHAVEHDLIAGGPLTLQVAGEPAFLLRLLPHAEIGEGRAPDRSHWWVEEAADGTFRLVLSRGPQRGYALARGADQVWRGRRYRLPAVDISLIPGNEPAANDPAPGPGLVDALLRAAGVFGGQTEPTPRLVDALSLLSAVVPGVGERLRRLAEAQADAGLAARLTSLAEQLAEPPQSRDVDRTLKFEIGYIRAEIDG